MNEKITLSWVEVELANIRMKQKKDPYINFIKADPDKYKQLLEIAKEKLKQCEN